MFGGGTQSRLDSENEDLRGVIDDLTVENKRLKQAIRLQHRQKRSTPSDASQQDKLFEVRMHGLPPEKRRELEYLLKNFATSVHTPVPTKSTSTTNISTGTSSSGQHRSVPKASRADSGYASQSNSAHRSGSMGAASASAPVASTNKKVKNYLRDIPDTLLPKQSPVMSERAKSALVVRRLEQLFTGRKAIVGHHDQPLQQQEISQNAARMDRIQDVKNNKRKRPEGSREAYVMPPDSRFNFDIADDVDPNAPNMATKGHTDTTAPDTATSGSGSPNQRPTRPLDLDINRAQHAAENIQYIRHLGLATSQPDETNDSEENPWVFVNLLAGLAQLHTLNVSSDFIRRAIKKLSKHLELSSDGHKVRWVGGSTEGTKFAPEDEKAIEAVENDPQESADEVGTGGSSRRSKTTSRSNAAITSTQSEDLTSELRTSNGSKQLQTTTSGSSNMCYSLPAKTTTTGSAFDYRPIVYQGESRLVDDEFLRGSDESSDSRSGDSSGLVHALSKSNLNQKSKDEGLITFYNNPYFCSDFSSDKTPPNLLKHQRPVIVGETLGIDMPADITESPLRYHDATYFTPRFAPTPYTPHSQAEEEQCYLHVSTSESMLQAGEDETIPREMEVCGLGGIMPDDNFALDVKVIRSLAAVRGPGVITKRLPFSGRQYVQNYAWQIKSCQKLDLLPSKLPPPSYVFFTSSSSSDTMDMDDISDSDSDSSSSPLIDEECPAPPTFLMQFSGSSADNADDDEMDEDDSSEIDMLAIARRVNPQQIAEQERVYMINQPGGSLRGVAGSLAATVGASRSSASIHEVAAVMSSATSQHGSTDTMDGGDDDDDDDETEDA